MNFYIFGDDFIFSMILNLYSYIYTLATKSYVRSEKC